MIFGKKKIRVCEKTLGENRMEKLQGNGSLNVTYPLPSDSAHCTAAHCVSALWQSVASLW